MLTLENIPEKTALEYKNLLAELRPEWTVDVINEDINLYKLGFIEYIPCSVIIYADDVALDALQEELYDMEYLAYRDEEILNEKFATLNENEKQRKKEALEYIRKYDKYKILQCIFY